jgi:hypothetical protein
MNIHEKLSAIQSEMKAPKNLYNSFGKYSYRNAEGICEAFKPYGKKYGLSLVLSDEVVEIGGRVYVMATASLYDTESPDSIGVSAFAREAETKKGMDDAQVTGATSSYARKYALNGLFLLDDTKDPDTDEYRQQVEKGKADDKPAGYPPVNEMQKACEAYYKGENLKNMLAYFGADSIANLSKAALMKAWDQMQKGRKK